MLNVNCTDCIHKQLIYILSSISKLGQVNMDNPTLSNISARRFVRMSKLRIEKAVIFWPAGYFFS